MLSVPSQAAGCVRNWLSVSQLPDARLSFQDSQQAKSPQCATRRIDMQFVFRGL